MNSLEIRTAFKNKDYQKSVLEDIIAERGAQDEKWGDQTGHSDGKWFVIEVEEIGEVARNLFEGGDPYHEIVQCAAVLVAWAEALQIRRDLASIESVGVEAVVIRTKASYLKDKIKEIFAQKRS